MHVSPHNPRIVAKSTLVVIALALTFVTMVGVVSRAMTTTEEGSKLLRHVVMFKFKDSSSKEDVAKVVDAFRGLPKKISEIAAYEDGTNNSPEGLNNGFTHCFFITFKTEAGRDVYLKHPAHQAFVDVLKPHLDKVHVVDYWAN